MLASENGKLQLNVSTLPIQDEAGSGAGMSGTIPPKLDTSPAWRFISNPPNEVSLICHHQVD